MQVQSSHLSSQTPIHSQAHPEAVEGQLPSSRATRPPSTQPLASSQACTETHKGQILNVKVTQAPLSTSKTLELNPDAGLTFKTLQVAFKALQAAFKTLQAAFKTLQATFMQPLRLSG
ncbi:hypothetical protein BKA83DRAFT_4497089 [Pisolithus microcarpus]|nr:hypothetical protein BKA83DRAFT_4497089 [Pisolithus microcarpus]